MNQASRPVRFVVSPMQRTIATILPTIEALNGNNSDGSDDPGACNVMINGFYFESEGCHTREKVEPGMNAKQINASLLNPAGVNNASFEGFPNGEENGWYSHGKGPETRHESEERYVQFEFNLVCSSNGYDYLPTIFPLVLLHGLLQGCQILCLDDGISRPTTKRGRRTGGT